MTFHRYDPETCGGLDHSGGHRDHREATRSALAGFLVAGFLIGLGTGSVAAVWLAGATAPEPAAIQTATAPTGPPSHAYPVRHAEFVRETPAPR